MPALLWFRRDLRMRDLPALPDAAAVDGDVLACYVLDPRLKASSGPRRLQFLYDSLRELRDALDGRLLVTRGRPETRIPALASAWWNWNRNFDTIEVDTCAAAERSFEAWKAGRTGFPIVDAGMRQLAQTGYMHNRVRMIVASFLVKDLHLPWQWGARWFLEQLVDGDMANNQHGWQWAAGCGTDAARTSGCSTPPHRARSSIRTATTCAAGCPS